MKILFSPSESKTQGGEAPFKFKELLFPQLSPLRQKLIKNYNEIIKKKDMRELSKMFGLKKEEQILLYTHNILQEPAKKAILRYQGVAFDYLNYATLSKEAQNYIDNNLIIFSNLFGFIRADNPIPPYRLKQGSSIGEIKPEQHYKEESYLLESYLEGEEILDLRAGFYDKFYKPKKSYTTLKFIKEGKVVSHWAKAYRGLVLRAIAQAQANSIEAFMNLSIENLTLKEIQTKKNRTEIIYTITP